MKVAVYDVTGTKKEDKKLNDKVFGLDVNKALLGEVVVLLQSNLRQGGAKAKNKGEVSGGGKKPWKQKGTGRARTGSIRNPLWRGGGIVFGPTGEENWYKEIPAKKKAGALLNAVSAKAQSGAVVILSELKLKEAKTKELATALKNIKAEGRVLLVLPENDAAVLKAGNNIENLKIAVASNINALEVMLADVIIFANGAEDKLEGLVK